MTNGKGSEKSTHNHRIRVIYGDTDAAGVVYYANYLRYMEAARTEFMRIYCDSYHSIESRGFILPVVEVHARYKASARYDDEIIVETCLAEAGKSTCRFDYRIVRAEDSKLLALGYTVHAVVTKEGRLSRFPGELQRKLALLI